MNYSFDDESIIDLHDSSIYLKLWPSACGHDPLSLRLRDSNCPLKAFFDQRVEGCRVRLVSKSHL